MFWTVGDVNYLRQHAHEGKIACAQALGRSPASVAMFASRSGISLRTVPETAFCIRCGEASTHIGRKTELCPKCTARAQLEQAQAAHREAVLALQRNDADIEHRAAELKKQKLALIVRTSRVRKRAGTRPRADKSNRKK